MDVGHCWLLHSALPRQLLGFVRFIRAPLHRQAIEAGATIFSYSHSRRSTLPRDITDYMRSVPISVKYCFELSTKLPSRW